VDSDAKSCRPEFCDIQQRDVSKSLLRFDSMGQVVAVCAVG